MPNTVTMVPDAGDFPTCSNLDHGVTGWYGNQLAEYRFESECREHAHGAPPFPPEMSGFPSAYTWS